MAFDQNMSNIKVENNNPKRIAAKHIIKSAYILLFHTLKATHISAVLKEYYEIVGESRPLSAFFPTHVDFFTEMHFYS